MSVVAGSLDFVLAAGVTAVVVFVAGLWITVTTVGLRARFVAGILTPLPEGTRVLCSGLRELTRSGPIP